MDGAWRVKVAGGQAAARVPELTARKLALTAPCPPACLRCWLIADRCKAPCPVCAPRLQPVQTAGGHGCAVHQPGRHAQPALAGEQTSGKCNGRGLACLHGICWRLCGTLSRLLQHDQVQPSTGSQCGQPELLCCQSFCSSHPHTHHLQAPEVLTGGSASVASDSFSMGVVLVSVCPSMATAGRRLAASARAFVGCLQLQGAAVLWRAAVARSAHVAQQATCGSLCFHALLACSGSS